MSTQRDYRYLADRQEETDRYARVVDIASIAVLAFALLMALLA